MIRYFCFLGPLAILLLVQSACDSGGITEPDQPESPEMPAPATIELVSGYGQTGTVGSSFDDHLVVKVQSEIGHPVEDFEVSFVLKTGDVSLQQSSILTNRQGEARTAVDIGQEYGPVEIHATATGLEGSPVVFNLQTWPVPVETGVLLEFSSEIKDMAIVHEREQIYASLKYAGKVVVADLQTGNIIEEIDVDSQPQKMDMSHDGSVLYVALYGSGAVAVIDLESLLITEVITVFSHTGDHLIYDVYEAVPGRVFVSATPLSWGSAYIAMIDRNNNNQLTRVASDRVIRIYPIFAADPDGQFLYVGQQSSSNTLFQLDLARNDVPILESVSLPESNMRWMAVSPDGSHLLTKRGKVISTTQFETIATIDWGASAFSGDGEYAYVAEYGNIGVYSTEEYTKIRSVSVGFQLGTSIILREERLAAYVLSDGKVWSVDLIP